MFETEQNGAIDALVDRSSTHEENQETLLLQALYSYSYDMQNGQHVSFEAGDIFTLVEKSTEDWWHVRKHRDGENFYVPANYVVETDYSEEESTGSWNSHSENSTLSPSSEGSLQDYEENTDKEGLDGEETTSFGSDDPDRIYANIPVREPGKRRHYSSGQQSRISRPKSATLPAGWTVETDNESGRTYYFNTKTNETSWKPPRGKSPYSDDDDDDTSRFSFSSLPRGWRLQKQSSVEEFLYVNDCNNEMWKPLKDEDGRTYYCSVNGNKTSWELPAFDDACRLKVPKDQAKCKLTPRHRMSSEGSDHNVVNLRHRSPQLHLRNSRSTSMIVGLGTQSLNITEMSSFSKGHKRTSSDKARDALTLSDDFPAPPVVPELNYCVKKQGTVNRKKLCEKGGKRLKKTSWSPCFLKLSSTNMILYKNQSAATPKPGSFHGRPESSCDLRGAIIEKMPDENKRRNILQVATVSKLCFLLQVDDVHEFSNWYHMIADVLKYLDETQPLESGIKAKLCGDIVPRPRPPSFSASIDFSGRGSLKKIRDGDKKNIRDRLKKLMSRRPTIEELQKKGIIKDIIFGCHMAKLCEREQTNIPKVVISCVEAIEGKGFDFDGLYRICGNVSSIQQLRIAVDQEDDVTLGQRPFDDVHVLTGTLKLYFRELPEPLFPFDFYDDFVNAIKLAAKREKTTDIRDQINKLPSPNCDTLRYLFKHLKRVMENSHKNRMHAHNLAIVFGPTLLAPREEHGNIALNTVYQNQIVEYILLEYDEVLGKDK